jgi:hypothetical protein
MRLSHGSCRRLKSSGKACWVFAGFVTSPRIIATSHSGSYPKRVESLVLRCISVNIANTPWASGDPSGH